MCLYSHTIRTTQPATANAEVERTQGELVERRTRHTLVENRYACAWDMYVVTSSVLAWSRVFWPRAFTLQAVSFTPNFAETSADFAARRGGTVIAADQGPTRSSTRGAVHVPTDHGG